MKIIPLSESLLGEVIAFVVRLNQDSAHHVSDFGVTIDEVRDDLAAIMPPQGEGYLAVNDLSEIVGLLGVEIDLELGRCWLLGPLVDHPGWDSVAEALYDQILAIIPPEVNDQQLSFDSANNNLEGFALRHDFNFYTEAVVLALDKSRQGMLPPADGLEFDDKYAEEFIALHAELFPNTYYSGSQLLEKSREPQNHLFMYIQDGLFAGYIFLQARTSSQDAYIDFLGVDESLRRQGIGKNLLASGLNWAFSRPGINKVTLSVRSSDIPTVRLYDSLGFTSERKIRAYRKKG